jgi:hypothetical protein
MEYMKSIIFNVSELDEVDFSKVIQTPQTLIYSVNKNKTYVSWTTIETPEFVYDMESAEGPYTQNELLSIIEGYEWLLII